MVAPEERVPNAALRAARRGRRWSQEELARVIRAAGAAHGSPVDCRKRLIQRWEAGEIRCPQPVYLRILERVFETSAVDLGFTLEEGEIGGETVERRAFLTVAATAGLTAAAPGESWQRLAWVLSHPTGIDEATLRLLENQTAAFFDAEETTPARLLAADLSEHVDIVTGLLATAPDKVRPRLASIAGTAAALAGWLAYDLGRPDDARGNWDAAIEAARQAGDGSLLACVLAYLSYPAAENGDHRRAATLLDVAGQYVRSPREAGARAWISGRAAEELAAAGDAGPALVALERAMTSYDYADAATARPWARFFDSARLGSMAVSTYGLLDHRDLSPAADAVLDSLGPGDHKTRAVILGDVAAAYLRRGDVDAGCDIASQALTATTAGEATLGRQRLAALVPLLDRHRDAQAVRTLRLQLEPFTT